MAEGKILFDGGIKTQSVESVKAMLEFLNGEQVRELPAVVRMANGTRLTKSSKGDCFYMTTSKACSCPANTYHPGQSCKHMKALLTGNSVEASRAQARAYQARQRAARLKPTEQQVDSIRPAGKWAGGHNGPVLEVV